MGNLECCCFIQETLKTCITCCWHLSLAENQTIISHFFSFLSNFTAFVRHLNLVSPSIRTSGWFFVRSSVSAHFCLKFLSTPPHFLLCLQPVSSTSVKLQGLEPPYPCCLEVLALISLSSSLRSLFLGRAQSELSNSIESSALYQLRVSLLCFCRFLG